MVCRVVRDAVVEGGREAGCGSAGEEVMRIVRGVVERVRARVGKKRRRKVGRKLVRRMVVAIEVEVWNFRGCDVDEAEMKMT